MLWVRAMTSDAPHLFDPETGTPVLVDLWTDPVRFGPSTVVAARIAELDEQIHNCRQLAWNASQMRRSPIRLLEEMDRLIDEKRRLEGQQ